MSGGVIDGDKAERHEHYRYGGMWKNKHEAVSAKKPRKKSKKSRIEGDAQIDASEAEIGEAKHVKWSGHEVKYTRNDQVMFEGELWVCRKSHVSEETKSPKEMKNLWKEEVAWKEED